ncbi:uncharacterized protein LOC128729566 [Anopheles nili]|uniref:uncharacterized protein LOC128729566 n=1 Tax=Anopheles nili TaxID=185578 RepID=UPI00237B6416|nr:uncharacterized protein LOC128729566 [Anopheles nili]
MADLRLFSREYISELIELYRSFPCLWKVNSEDYSDRSKRKVAYDALVAKYREVDKHASKETVKKKLYGLRSCYRRELAKLKKSVLSGAGVEEVYKPTLWYFYLFDFLMDNELPNDDTRGITEAYQNGVKEEETVEYFDDDDAEGTDVDYIDNDEDESDESSNCDAVDPFDSGSLGHYSSAPKRESAPAGSAPRSQPPKKKRKLLTKNSRKVGFIEPVVEKHSTSVTGEDQFDVYGKLVAHKLRSFDKLQATFSQRLINEILFEGEMGVLNRNYKVVDMADH